MGKRESIDGTLVFTLFAVAAAFVSGRDEEEEKDLCIQNYFNYFTIFLSDHNRFDFE